MRFSKERVFPDSKDNSKVTITVRFSLLVDLSCDVSVTHVNTVNPNAVLLKESGSSTKKSSKFGFRFLDWRS